MVAHAALFAVLAFLASLLLVSATPVPAEAPKAADLQQRGCRFGGCHFADPGGFSATLSFTPPVTYAQASASASFESSAPAPSAFSDAPAAVVTVDASSSAPAETPAVQTPAAAASPIVAAASNGASFGSSPAPLVLAFAGIASTILFAL